MSPMNHSVRVAILLVVPSWVMACSGAQKESRVLEEATLPSSTASIAPLAPGQEPLPTEVAEASTADRKPGEPEKPAPESEPAPGTPGAERTVKYVVRSDGLRVLTEGLAFTPKARAIRVGSGWGLEISVEVRAEDEALHSLLAPEASEIALAGEIHRAVNDELEEFSDRRESDRDLEVARAKPIRLMRTWPSKGGPRPLAVGDELGLEMGIWGLGTDKASRRPLNRLARVDLKFEKGRPRVKVAAPEGIPK